MTQCLAPGATADRERQQRFVRLSSRQEQRARSQQEIAAIAGLAREFTAARVNVTQEASMGSVARSRAAWSSAPIADARDATRRAAVFVAKHRRAPRSRSSTATQIQQPRVRVSIERAECADVGCQHSHHAETVQAGMSGQRFGHFVYNGKQYTDRPAVADLDRVRTISRISRPNDGRPQMVSLDNLISLTEASSPPELLRYNRYAAATVSGTLAPGRSLSEGIAPLTRSPRDARRALHYPLTGSRGDYVESSSSLRGCSGSRSADLPRARSAVREFRGPARDLVHRAASRSRERYLRCGTSADTEHLLADGLIMLVGLVAKNGILIVSSRTSAARPVLRRRSPPVRERPRRGCADSDDDVATILGTVPIALALGAGAESRVSMEIAVIGASSSAADSRCS